MGTTNEETAIIRSVTTEQKAIPVLKKIFLSESVIALSLPHKIFMLKALSPTPQSLLRFHWL
jgi:hypothetical protein